MRPIVAEINLDALRSNYALLQATVQRHAGTAAGLLAVIKANAYGHGLAICGPALAAAGARWLGITSVDEALALLHALRHAQPTAGPPPRILAMSGFWPGEEAALIHARITPQIWEPWHLSLLDAAARRAKLPAHTLPIHLELDTGMTRQGVFPGPALAALLANSTLAAPDSPLHIEGVLTHFSSPAPDSAVMHAQIARLAEGLAQLRAAGIRPPLIHAGNSVNAGEGAGLAPLAAIAREARATLLVRPGLGLYGIGGVGPPAHAGAAAQADPTAQPAALQPVLTWKTEITSLRDIPAGTPVGYNETFRASRPMRLALVPAGYADGLNRLLSNCGSMLVRGQRAPIVGRISMDQAMLDVTAIPQAAPGDPVVLLGRQLDAHIPVQEQASLCGTIPYEVLCAIAARVQRIAV